MLNYSVAELREILLVVIYNSDLMTLCLHASFLILMGVRKVKCIEAVLDCKKIK